MSAETEQYREKLERISYTAGGVAVAAQVLRDLYATTIPCPCASCRTLRSSIERFAAAHGIDIEGGDA